MISNGLLLYFLWWWLVFRTAFLLYQRLKGLYSQEELLIKHLNTHISKCSFTNIYFRTVVGSFDVSLIPNNKYKVEILILWLICTFLIFVVMLNMLIALINDIFAKIYQSINNNMLQELAVLMVESELLISRAKLFYGKKYIIVVTKEKPEYVATDITSQLGMMKSNMNKKFKEHTRVLMEITDNLEK